MPNLDGDESGIVRPGGSSREPATAARASTADVAESAGATGDEIEAVLHALADSRRREMLALVFDGEMASGDLAAASRLTRPAASQHLKLLRDAGLVLVRVDANRRFYRADNERIAAVARHLEEYWAGPLARLSASAAAEHRSIAAPPAPQTHSVQQGRPAALSSAVELSPSARLGEASA